MIYGPKYSQSLGGWYEYEDRHDTVYLLDATTRARTGRSFKRPSNIPIASLTNPNPPQPTTGPGPVSSPRETSTSNPRPSLATEIVKTIRYTVHNTGQLQNSQCSDNHTSAYLLLSGNTNAVQINMRTEPSYIDGVYEIRDRNYQQSTSRITHFDYPASKRFTAQDVNNLLCREGFNKYTFTGGSIGCRYRNIVVLRRLELEGFMSPGSATDLHSRLPFQFSTLTRATRPWPIVQGTFDSSKTQDLALKMWASIGELLGSWINQELAKPKPDGANVQRWEAQLQAHGTTTEQGRILAEKRKQEEREQGESGDEEEEEDEDEDD